jgi:uncharacterized protein
MANNVFGEPLKICGTTPLTGFYRDGFCNTGADDSGLHIVCAVMTEEFLVFSKSRGNDLSTPIPLYRFAGLKPGDNWCLCGLRWVEAWKAGKAPKIILEATHEKILDYVPLQELVKYAWKNEPENSLSE